MLFNAARAKLSKHIGSKRSRNDETSLVSSHVESHVRPSITSVSNAPSMSTKLPPSSFDDPDMDFWPGDDDEDCPEAPRDFPAPDIPRVEYSATAASS